MVGTPKVAAKKAPQLFQGTSAPVGVPAAPMVRDRTTGANPRLWKALLNIRPGKTIAINWSAVTMLVAITAPTVAATREPADFAALMTGSISRSTTPAFSH